MPNPNDLAEWLTEWLPTQRWYADKSRTLTRVEVMRRIPVHDGTELIVALVSFEQGEPSIYAAPIELGIEFGDATGSPAFLRWLGGIVDGTSNHPPEIVRGMMVSQMPDLRELPTKPLGFEQSNTSIQYGSDWIIKLQRRLSFGQSPELELAPLLNRWTGRPTAPTTLGSLDIEVDGQTATLAVASVFVPNVGDGWSFFSASLREVHQGGGKSDALISEVEALAVLTADMHGALAGDPWTRELAPERITRSDVEAWMAAVSEHSERVHAALRAHRPTLSGEAASLADVVLSREPGHASAVGLERLAGSYKTRIHGDFHLGQMLRLPEGGYLAVDFDGEPQRPLHERRAKYSPLRDVAGLLRSFAYASATAAMESASATHRRAALRQWEYEARETSLAAYMKTVRTHRPDLIPSADDEVRQAVEALELEKAIYEVEYELNNRPAWLWLPLTQLARTG